MGAPKDQTHVFLEHQWIPVDWWKENHRNISSCSKMILVPRNIFSNSIFKGKIKLYNVNTNSKISMPEFQVAQKLKDMSDSHQIKI